MREIEQQSQTDNIQFDDIVVACGRLFSSLFYIITKMIWTLKNLNFISESHAFTLLMLCIPKRMAAKLHCIKDENLLPGFWTKVSEEFYYRSHNIVQKRRTLIFSMVFCHLSMWIICFKMLKWYMICSGGTIAGLSLGAQLSSLKAEVSHSSNSYFHLLNGHVTSNQGVGTPFGCIDSCILSLWFSGILLRLHSRLDWWTASRCRFTWFSEH